MNQTNCEHVETFRVSGKCSDCCLATYPSGVQHDGSAPFIAGLGGGDYVELEVCLECKQVLGFDPSDVRKGDLQEQLHEARWRVQSARETKAGALGRFDEMTSRLSGISAETLAADRKALEDQLEAEAAIQIPAREAEFSKLETEWKTKYPTEKWDD